MRYLNLLRIIWKKKKNLKTDKVFTLSAEIVLAVITDLIWLRFVSKSLAYFDFGIFFHSSVLNFSNSFKIDGVYWWIGIFISCHRFPEGFTSGLWLGHSKTQTISHKFSSLQFMPCSLVVLLNILLIFSSIHFACDGNQPSSSSRWKGTLEHDANTTTKLYCRNGIPWMFGMWFALNIMLLR